jgi:putative endonuclease
MAFMRSPVRSRSGPPPFARHTSQSELRVASQPSLWIWAKAPIRSELKSVDWRRVPTVARSAKVGRYSSPSELRLASHHWQVLRKICIKAPLVCCLFSRTFAGPSRKPIPCAWNRRCNHHHMAESKCCVYVLRSLSNRTRYYTGVTSNWGARLDVHNSGKCPHTVDGRPWEIDVFVQFTDEPRALAFERYLKSGSGFAFAQRHFR